VEAVDDPGSAAEIGRTIGRRVRTGRIGLGWTLDQLAQHSGVSRRMLVNVEQGATNPSIATLLRISDALGIGLPTLVDTAAGAEAPITVHRAGDARPVWRSTAGGSAVMVAGTPQPDVNELWDWRLGPGDTHRSEAHRPGTRELLLVLSGALTLVVGDASYRLSSGDSANFDGSLPHSYVNPSRRRPSRFALSVHERSTAAEAW
jgi:transcriptional regulator with XRE-family HTH domain